MLPLLPFSFPRAGEHPRTKFLIWPWIYLSLTVPLSYLTYIDPANLREFRFVRLIEYLPTFGLLGCALVIMLATAENRLSRCR